MLESEDDSHNSEICSMVSTKEASTTGSLSASCRHDEVPPVGLQSQTEKSDVD